MLEKLKAGLEKLTGRDLERLAKEERTINQNSPLLDIETSFQARIAAQALGTNFHELMDLPLKKYDALCSAVSQYLAQPAPNLDIEKLKENLDKLTGHDLEAVTIAERRAGNQAVKLDTSKSFQARLAAKALDMDLEALRDMSMLDYNAAVVTVFILRNTPDSPT